MAPSAISLNARRRRQDVEVAALSVFDWRDHFQGKPVFWWVRNSRHRDAFDRLIAVIKDDTGHARLRGSPGTSPTRGMRPVDQDCP